MNWSSCPDSYLGHGYYVVIVEKVINIYQNSRSQTAMESVWSVSKFSTEFVGSRRELVANCVHTADADGADATKQFRRVGVGGVYWALSFAITEFARRIRPYRQCGNLQERWWTLDTKARVRFA